jgi:aminocarboxymuconate-semialdehyde decarboxylase
MRKIDVFTHIFPAAYAGRMGEVAPGFKDAGKRVRGVPMLVDLDERFRVMDRFEGYEQVLSIATPPIEVFASPRDAVDLARRANDGMAELVRKYPERFPGFVASLPLNDPDEALRETHRAIGELGARGIQLFTNIRGKPLVAPEFLPLFDAMAGFDLPIWLHPYRGADIPDYASEDHSEYEIWWTFGWPYETSVAMSRLVFAGYFDKFPNLKIITHHMGGMIPYFEGRVGYGWDQLGKRTTDVDYVSLLNSMKKRPVDYFKNFYADTALFGAAPATKCGLDFFGLDNILYASDMPFEPTPGLYARETIKCVEGLDLTKEQKDQIYRGNAERLLKLKPASAKVRS